jgi:hypothetical protein
MFRKIQSLITICVLVVLVTISIDSARANWMETFDGDQPDLATWQFVPLPDLTKTFTNTIVSDPNGTKYLSLDETTPAGDGGSLFGAGYIEEDFTDVRIGAIVNVTGDASHNYCGLLARMTAIIDPDGSITGVAPGFFPQSVYVMHVNWEDGPANLRIDIEKVINVSNIMENEEELGLDVLVQGLDNARSFYAELDVVGSGPVYVTGSLYEYKDGPLVARTATMVDTNGNDPWEEDVGYDEPFMSGESGIFAQSEQLHEGDPVGYHCTFDDVFSVSDGPAAAGPNPADGAVDVPVDTSLNWVEAEFATGRELWIGKPGAMEKVEPAPSGTTYTPGNLELGQTYEWRIDQIGPAGTVTGHTWTFTVANYLTVEDFESYVTDEDLRSAWVDNIEEPGVEYVLLATGGNNAMRFEFQNQYEPYFTEVTRTFNSPQDWTVHSVEELSLSFIGTHENVEHLMYLRLEDAAGQSFTVENPYKFACQSDSWRQWTIDLGLFSDGGVDLTSVKKITIGMGDGTNSGQLDKDRDYIFVDQIILSPASASD